MNLRSVAWLVAPALTFTACSSSPVEEPGSEQADVGFTIPIIRLPPALAVTPTCGTGNLLAPLDVSTDAQAGWSTWFGGDNRPPPPVNFHPRNVAYGVKVVRPYAS